MTSIIKHLLLNGKPGEQCTVQGWLRTKRESKNITFLELNDGSTLKGLQVLLSNDMNLDPKLLSRLTTGASLSVTGELKDSPGSDQALELEARTVTLIGDSPADLYPLQKKRHSLEFLREIAHLRPRTNLIGAVMRVRNTISRAIHDFFQNENFLWVHTPIITGSDCEGAGQMFQVTTLDPLNPPLLDDGTMDYSEDFFAKKTSLTVSGQLEGEALALALSRIYTFGPTFRAENSNTTRHLSEFWMVEPEAAFMDLDGNMDLAERFLKYIITEVLQNCAEDMAFFTKYVNPDVSKDLDFVVSNPFAHVSYTEAVSLLEKADLEFEFPVSWGVDLQSEHEKYLTEKVFKCPLIVTDYPKDIKAFYMKLNADGKTVRAMDILVPRIGEIIGGSEREADLSILTERMKEAGLSPVDYSWYLDLRRFGSVPHAGFGLGLERMVQFVTGVQNIRDVIPFPRSPKNAEF